MSGECHLRHTFPSKRLEHAVSVVLAALCVFKEHKCTYPQFPMSLGASSLADVVVERMAAVQEVGITFSPFWCDSGICVYLPSRVACSLLVFKMFILCLSSFLFFLCFSFVRACFLSFFLAYLLVCLLSFFDFILSLLLAGFCFLSLPRPPVLRVCFSTCHALVAVKDPSATFVAPLDGF